MKNSMWKKGLVLVIIMLFVGAGVVPCISGNIENIVTIDYTKLHVSQPNVIVVPDNYSKIQDAIDNATAGNTIFVRSGIYNESLTVNKPSIILIGENKINTIINGNENVSVIDITADCVSISGFTIQNCSQDDHYAGIAISHSNNNTIYGNTIKNNGRDGIFVNGSYNNIIKNTITLNIHGIFVRDGGRNSIAWNEVILNENGGIWLDGSGHNIISENNISSNIYDSIWIESKYNVIEGNMIMGHSTGMVVWYDYNTIIRNNISSNGGHGIELKAYHNNVIGNTISDNNGDGILVSVHGKFNNISCNIIKENWVNGINIDGSTNNIIDGNIITGNRVCGLLLADGSTLNIIIRNTFKNTLAIEKSSLNRIYCNNFYDGVGFRDCLNRFFKNYWDRPMIFPKIIIGVMGILPFFQVDLFPAKEPY